MWSEKRTRDRRRVDDKADAKRTKNGLRAFQLFFRAPSANGFWMQRKYKVKILEKF